MKFRLKITFCMLALLSILFGIGGSVLIVSSFQDTMKRMNGRIWSMWR